MMVVGFSGLVTIITHVCRLLYYNWPYMFFWFICFVVFVGIMKHMWYHSSVLFGSQFHLVVVIWIQPSTLNTLIVYHKEHNNCNTIHIHIHNNVVALSLLLLSPFLLVAVIICIQPSTLNLASDNVINTPRPSMKCHQPGSARNMIAVVATLNRSCCHWSRRRANVAQLQAYVHEQQRATSKHTQY